MTGTNGASGFEEFLSKSRVFAELMQIYLNCNRHVQSIIGSLVQSLADPETTEEERDTTYGTIAGALLAARESRAARTATLKIPPRLPGRKALDEAQRAEFARRLRDRRAAKGWTQEELARRSGIGQPAISLLENGQSRPQGTTLVKLAQALGVGKGELWPAAAELNARAKAGEKAGVRVV